MIDFSDEHQIEAYENICSENNRDDTISAAIAEIKRLRGIISETAMPSNQNTIDLPGDYEISYNLSEDKYELWGGHNRIGWFCDIWSAISAADRHSKMANVI